MKSLFLCSNGVKRQVHIVRSHKDLRGIPGGSVVKNPPAVQQTKFQPLVWEDPLEKEMATHSSILAWRIPWTEEPGGSIGSMGVTKSQAWQSNYTIRTQKAQDIIFIVVDIIKYLLSRNPQKYWQEDWTPCSYSEGNWSGLVLVVKGRGSQGTQKTGDSQVIIVTLLKRTSLTWPIY